MPKYSLFSVKVLMVLTAHLTNYTTFIFKANERARTYKFLDPKAAIKRNWTRWLIILVLDVAVAMFAVKAL